MNTPGNTGSSQGITTPVELAPLVDGFNRVHTDLRVSLTDRCSLRCTYCMPETGNIWLANDKVLTADELERTVSLFVRMGVTTVRLTGGEPLLRPDLLDIVSRLSALRTPQDEPISLSMTTNGIGLEKVVNELVEAGLSRVNISLDTLNRQKFAELTKRDRIDDVLRGIQAATESSLSPVKLNAVAMRGVNEDELIDLVDFALSMNAQMRFIEQMPLDISHSWKRESLLSGEEIHRILSQKFTLTPQGNRESSPAEMWHIDGSDALVGIIASVTAPFCSGCNRLRLTADGQVRNCLFATEESDLRAQLRLGASEHDLETTVRVAVLGKRAGHGIGEPEFTQPERGMNAIGG